MDKILSIIIPSYNMEAYLPQCLNSLVCDQMDRLDVIVVNDGSKDATLRIAGEYAERYPETVTVIDKPNGNYGSCINAGLKQVKGKYVKVLDADDSFESANLPTFIKFLSKTDADMIVSDYCRVNEKGDVTGIYTFDGLGEEKARSFGDCMTEFSRESFQMHAVAYKSTVFNGLNYHQSEGLSYTDMEWMFLPVTRVSTVARFPHIIYRYLVGREGQTVDVKVSLKAVDQTATVLETLLRNYKMVQCDIDDIHREYLEQRIRIKAPSVYRIYLLKQSDASQWKRLKQFDDSLKANYPQMYEEMNNQTIKVLPFHYITYWRRNYKGQPLTILKAVSYVVSKVL
ncbi:MAG: glycosyltransferase family 2 protein [Bacteroidales bacterium]|nr:glycosyltransferase family 2 protein [Bacteroidales bacterium]